MRVGIKPQTLNGVRWAAVAIGAFIGLLCLIDGELRLVRGLEQGRPIYALLGLLEVCVVAAFLWLTASVWSQWITALAALGALKATVSLFFGTSASPPYVNAPMHVILETWAGLIMIAITCSRFLTYRPTPLERAALLVLAFSLPAAMLWPSSHILLLGIVPCVGTQIGMRRYHRAKHLVR